MLLVRSRVPAKHEVLPRAQLGGRVMSARASERTDEARLKERVVRLERCLADQKQKALEWERAATRYHAQLLQARVALIRAGKDVPS